MSNIALLSTLEIHTELSNSTNTTIKLFNSVPQIVESIIQHPVNLIILDVDHICNTVCGIHNVISMLNTLNQLIQSPTLIAVLLDNHISLIELKNILDCDINGIIPKVSWLGEYETATALVELLDNHNYKPKSLIAKFTQTHKHKSLKLTVRQQQICTMICKQGASNKLIARQLKIAESTVKVHVTEIFKKLNVRNRTQLAAFMK